MTLANASAIRRALENAGVELIEENGRGPGARLKQRLELIDENGGGPGVKLRKPGKDKAPQIVRSFASAPCAPFDWANRLILFLCKTFAYVGQRDHKGHRFNR